MWGGKAERKRGGTRELGPEARRGSQAERCPNARRRGSSSSNSIPSWDSRGKTEEMRKTECVVPGLCDRDERNVLERERGDADDESPAKSAATLRGGWKGRKRKEKKKADSQGKETEASLRTVGWRSARAGVRCGEPRRDGTRRKRHSRSTSSNEGTRKEDERRRGLKKRRKALAHARRGGKRSARASR